MTATLLPPDVRRILAELDRRLGALERRINPVAAVAVASSAAFTEISPGIWAFIPDDAGDDVVLGGDKIRLIASDQVELNTATGHIIMTATEGSISVSAATDLILWSSSGDVSFRDSVGILTLAEIRTALGL